jgi:hypothetical protein
MQYIYKKIFFKFIFSIPFLKQYKINAVKKLHY